MAMPPSMPIRTCDLPTRLLRGADFVRGGRERERVAVTLDLLVRCVDHVERAPRRAARFRTSGHSAKSFRSSMDRENSPGDPSRLHSLREIGVRSRQIATGEIEPLVENR